jgi:hypothetical protein
MKKKLLYIILVIILMLFFIEYTLKQLGYTAYKKPYQNLEVTPSFYIGHDSLLGFGLNSGDFNITLNDTFTCKYTINELQNRITSFQDLNFNKKVIIMGCSFTFGDLLNDDQTHPFKLQSYLIRDSIKVVNLGVSGYGPTQFLLQLKQIKNDDNSIKALIINYASFQDGRTTLTRSWRYWLEPSSSKHSFNENVMLPYTELKNNSLLISTKQLTYKLRPLQDKLAFVQLIDNIFNIKENNTATQITEKVFYAIAELCKNKNIPLLVAALSKDDKTIQMINKLKAKGIKTINYNIDLNKPEYNFQPIDWHPNEKANTIFADSIIKKLNKMNIVK